MKTDLEPWKTNLEPWKNTKTDLESWKTKLNLPNKTYQSKPTNQIKLTKLNILSQGNHESKRSPTLDCVVPLAMFLELLVLARKPEGKIEKERHGVEICTKDAHNGPSLHLLRPLWVSLGADPLQVFTNLAYIKSHIPLWKLLIKLKWSTYYYLLFLTL